LVANRSEFLTGHRVAHQNRSGDFEGVDNLENIICQPLAVITRRRTTGGTEATARDAVYVTYIFNFRGEVVENVRG
jgi:hypothetical protein